ncbi:Serine/threonine protein kinase [Giardia duodenalis assemblage B]|uniref:Serine/threonine protein kinase n=1 Tax=Giardia duodenalis assemblage B TaxID=1394984 RepID=A0A132NW16_GIAIN|nr:Serine/threonine protein kinase [Giardia intestinalis assemblage B]
MARILGSNSTTSSSSSRLALVAASKRCIDRQPCPLLCLYLHRHYCVSFRSLVLPRRFGPVPTHPPFLRGASVCPFTRSLSVRWTSIGPLRHHISGLTHLSVFAVQIRSTRSVGLSLCEGTLPSGCTRMCGTHDRPYWKTQPCLGSGYLCHYPQAFCLREANLQEANRRKDALIDGWSRIGCHPQRGFQEDLVLASEGSTIEELVGLLCALALRSMGCF